MLKTNQTSGWDFFELWINKWTEKNPANTACNIEYSLHSLFSYWVDPQIYNISLSCCSAPSWQSAGQKQEERAPNCQFSVTLSSSSFPSPHLSHSFLVSVDQTAAHTLSNWHNFIIDPLTLGTGATAPLVAAAGYSSEPRIQKRRHFSLDM